jgi:hypothetical protein
VKAQLCIIRVFPNKVEAWSGQPATTVRELEWVHFASALSVSLAAQGMAGIGFTGLDSQREYHIAGVIIPVAGRNPVSKPADATVLSLAHSR